MRLRKEPKSKYRPWIWKISSVRLPYQTLINKMKSNRVESWPHLTKLAKMKRIWLRNRILILMRREFWPSKTLSKIRLTDPKMPFSRLRIRAVTNEIEKSWILLAQEFPRLDDQGEIPKKEEWSRRLVKQTTKSQCRAKIWLLRWVRAESGKIRLRQVAMCKDLSWRLSRIGSGGIDYKTGSN